MGWREERNKGVRWEGGTGMMKRMVLGGKRERFVAEVSMVRVVFVSRKTKMESQENGRQKKMRARENLKCWIEKK